VFQYYYDFGFVLEAFRRVMEVRPCVELHLYGDGQQLASVRAQAAGLPNTYFHGRYDLGELLGRGAVGPDWVLLLPYRAAATFHSPIKLFEYMALGRPILGSALGQIPDIIEDGQNGSVYDPDRIDDLVERMKRLADDSELRDRLGRNAQKDFLHGHTWPARMATLWECLRSLR
jgi:alpha-maltose-1-phosphate synthase